MHFCGENSVWGTVENVEVGEKKINKKKENVNLHSFLLLSLFLMFSAQIHVGRVLIKIEITLALKWVVLYYKTCKSAQK